MLQIQQFPKSNDGSHTLHLGLANYIVLGDPEGLESFKRFPNNYLSLINVGSLESGKVIFVCQLGLTSKIQLILFPSLTSAVMAQSGMSRWGGEYNHSSNGYFYSMYRKEKGAEDNHVKERK